MSQLKDMTGQRIHRLLVLSRAPNRNGQAWWTCVCDCGKTLDVFGRSLRDGGAKSWCEENGIRPGTAFMRLHYGWLPVDAVTLPVQERGR